MHFQAGFVSLKTRMGSSEKKHAAFEPEHAFECDGPVGSGKIPGGARAHAPLLQSAADLCKLPVLFLLPNRLFPEFLDCTGA